jgi:hypothetical protein
VSDEVAGDSFVPSSRLLVTIKSLVAEASSLVLGGSAALICAGFGWGRSRFSQVGRDV